MRRKILFGVVTIIASILFYVNLNFPHEEKVTVADDYQRKENDLPKNEDKDLFYYQSINSEIVGILEFEDRVLPIVNPGNNDRYFRMDIYENYDSMGTPFIDEVSSLDSENIIIQGHSSNKNNFLFSFVGDLTKESKKDFRFILNDKEVDLVMIGVAEIDLTKDNVWLGYYQQDFRSGEKEMMISQFLEKAFIKYEEGIVNDATNFITLVTCDVDEENSRFVIIAREK